VSPSGRRGPPRRSPRPTRRSRSSPSPSCASAAFASARRPGCRQRTLRFTGLAGAAARGAARPCAWPLPAGARTGLPVFSHDGRRFAFARHLADRVELWTGDTATGVRPRRWPASASTTSSAPRFAWTGRGALLARDGPGGPRRPPRGPPRCRSGPVVEETAGKASQMATFQDILRTAHDAALFEHHATGAARPRGRGATGDGFAPSARRLSYTDVDPSPDGRFLLVRRLKSALLDPGPLLLLRSLGRGVGRDRPARRRRSPTSRSRTRSHARACPRGRGRWPGSRWCPRRSSGLEAQDGGDPKREGRAPRAPDEARGPLRRPRPPEVTAAQAALTPGSTGPARTGVAPGDGARPRPKVAHDVPPGPRLAADAPGSVFDLSARTTPTATPGSPVVETWPSGEAASRSSVGVPARVQRSRHGGTGRRQHAALRSDAREFASVPGAPGLCGFEQRHDPDCRRPRDGEQHVCRAARGGREGRNRQGRRNGSDRSEAGGRERPQLRRLHDRQPAGALGSLPRRRGPQRRLQPHADAVRLPERAAHLLGGARHLHEDVAVHLCRQDQRACPADPRRGGQQLGHLPRAERAAVSGPRGPGGTPSRCGAARSRRRTAGRSRRFALARAQA
jgi:hypothetical protein